jgi:DNA-binding NtrC family response regulator
MQPLNVVLLQSDAGVAQSLACALSKTFHSVQQVNSVNDLRTTIAKERTRLAIVDMERASVSDVEHLSHEFPAARFVCTHRLADEELWAAAMNAGAVDVCPSDDTRAILHAALTSKKVARPAAA